MKKVCTVKYCTECKKQMKQTYTREEAAHLVRTRKCPICGTSIRTVEILMDEYNETIEKLNKIIDILKEGGC